MKSIRTTIKEAAQIIRANDSIALICHTNPDGDTLGSAAALYIALTACGKRAQLFCDDKIPAKISAFLPAEIHFTKELCGDYQLLVAVDCADVYRLGRFSGTFAAHKNTLVLDHHSANAPFGSWYCLCEYSSTAEICYHVFDELRYSISKECANMLLMGLSTDTGNFAYNSTNADSLRVAAQLRQLGGDLPRINQLFFQEVTINRTKLMGRVLSRIRSYFDGKFCLLCVTQQDLRESSCTVEDSVDLVNCAINIDTALIGVSLFEHSPNSYKVSLRGKGITVRDIAEYFGGGGHDYAAGCQVNGLLEDVIDKLHKLIGDKLA